MVYCDVCRARETNALNTELLHLPEAPCPWIPNSAHHSGCAGREKHSTESYPPFLTLLAVPTEAVHLVWITSERGGQLQSKRTQLQGKPRDVPAWDHFLHMIQFKIKWHFKCKPLRNRTCVLENESNCTEHSLCFTSVNAVISVSHILVSLSDRSHTGLITLFFLLFTLALATKIDWHFQNSALGLSWGT